MKTLLRRQFPSDSKYLAEVNASAREIAESCCFPQLDSEKIGLAVEECVANCIEHAYRGRPDGSVEIDAAVDDAILRIDIVDRGETFAEPTDAFSGVEALAARKHRGGLGLFLVKAIADSVLHIREGDRNICRLMKRLPALGSEDVRSETQ